MAADPLCLVVSGASGRMGGVLAELCADDETIDLIGGIVRSGEDEVNGFATVRSVEDAGDLIRRADAVVDFSAPAFLRDLISNQGDALASRALIVGTTGLADDQHRALDELSARSPVLVAANFSVGVNLLLALARRTANVLGDDYDVEIIETHHRRKEDAPSGTALALASAVADGRGVDLAAVRRDGRSGRPGARPAGEIGMHSLRGGDVVGEHSVSFIGTRERVELGHVATDRALFAEGALRAARWLAGRSPGHYTMRDVLGLA
ncbi:MAG TPA: 4-hydroxy-tetrahydrodipicolinate reductase [Longimicrobiaceae bacterium]|nr:4-hydroxy-tetrahydrodipicolinate reductase [Longimicrobiaceae bacterium]